MRAAAAARIFPYLLVASVGCGGPAKQPLEVESEPPGAAIELDGVSTGKVTPATIELVGAGEHDVRLTLAGHIPFQRRLFQVAPGEKLTALLNPKLVLKVVSDPPGARVLQKGRVILQATPGELKLEAGAGDLRMELDGHVPVDLPGFVQPDRHEWSVKLEPAAFLEVESMPASLAIFLDRRDTNLVTPAKLVVGAKVKHEVLVCYKDACTPVQFSAALEPGATGSLGFRWMAPREH